MITFAYPGYNPTEFLELASPEVGDTDVGTEQLILHATKGGAYKSVVHRQEKEIYATTLQFNVCEKESAMAFFLQARKEYIKYTDYNGVEWMCQITSKSIDVIDGPNGFEFSIDINKWKES